MLSNSKYNFEHALKSTDPFEHIRKSTDHFEHARKSTDHFEHGLQKYRSFWTYSTKV